MNPTKPETILVDDHITQLKARIVELEAQIERLKTQHEEMLLKHAGEQSIALLTVESALKEIEELNVERWHLKTYTGRAAEVLQLCADYPIYMVMSVTLRERAKELLPELRKLPKIENPFEAEIKRHKDLHTRAADALDQFHGRYYVIENCDCAVCNITRELRKAAQ